MKQSSRRALRILAFAVSAAFSATASAQGSFRRIDVTPYYTYTVSVSGSVTMPDNPAGDAAEGVVIFYDDGYNTRWSVVRAGESISFRQSNWGYFYAGLVYHEAASVAAFTGQFTLSLTSSGGTTGTYKIDKTHVAIIKGASTSCTVDAYTLCLADGRFQVQADYRDYSGNGAAARAVALTNDSGYFWFFDSANVELVTKVVSFCSGSSGNWGLYASGLTDVQVTFKVLDTKYGTYRTYTNPLGSRFCTIADGPFSCP